MKREFEFTSKHGANFPNAVAIVANAQYAHRGFQKEEKEMIHYTVNVFVDQEAYEKGKVPIHGEGGQAELMPKEDYRETALRHVSTKDGFEQLIV